MGALDHPGSADEDRYGTLPVARQLLPLFINNLQFDAELAAALPRPDGVVEHVLPGFGELWRGRGQYAQRAHLGHAPDLADLNAEAVLEGFSHRARHRRSARSEEHTSELQSLMRISYAVF